LRGQSSTSLISFFRLSRPLGCLNVATSAFDVCLAAAPVSDAALFEIQILLQCVAKRSFFVKVVVAIFVDHAKNFLLEFLFLAGLLFLVSNNSSQLLLRFNCLPALFVCARTGWCCCSGLGLTCPEGSSQALQVDCLAVACLCVQQQTQPKSLPCSSLPNTSSGLLGTRAM
jgi:hypothetical protein